MKGNHAQFMIIFRQILLKVDLRSNKSKTLTFMCSYLERCRIKMETQETACSLGTVDDDISREGI